MTINISFTRPKVRLKKAGDEEEVVEERQSIFCVQNLVILGAGLAIGIIFRQQGEINALRNTVAYLQEVIR